MTMGQKITPAFKMCQCLVSRSTLYKCTQADARYNKYWILQLRKMRHLWKCVYSQCGVNTKGIKGQTADVTVKREVIMPGGHHSHCHWYAPGLCMWSYCFVGYYLSLWLLVALYTCITSSSCKRKTLFLMHVYLPLFYQWALLIFALKTGKNHTMLRGLV